MRMEAKGDAEAGTRDVKQTPKRLQVLYGLAAKVKPMQPGTPGSSKIQAPRKKHVASFSAD